MGLDSPHRTHRIYVNTSASTLPHRTNVGANRNVIRADSKELLCVQKY